LSSTFSHVVLIANLRTFRFTAQTLEGHRKMRRTPFFLAITAAAASIVLAQSPLSDLAKPPANARHLVIQSTGGKHGDSWSWIASNGARMVRESMNLRGQVFELDSEGKAGPDGMPLTVSIRGVTPSGDAVETFTISSGAGRLSLFLYQ
jgi:hypothetical protein